MSGPKPLASEVPGDRAVHCFIAIALNHILGALLAPDDTLLPLHQKQIFCCHLERAMAQG